MFPSLPIFMEELTYLLENPQLTKYGLEALGSTALGAAYRGSQYLRSEKLEQHVSDHSEPSKELSSSGITLAGFTADYAREMTGKNSLFDPLDYGIILSGTYLGQSLVDRYSQEELDEVDWKEALKK